MDLTKLFQNKVYEDPDKDRRFKKWAEQKLRIEKDNNKPYESTTGESLDNTREALAIRNEQTGRETQQLVDRATALGPIADQGVEREIRRFNGMVDAKTGAQRAILGDISNLTLKLDDGNTTRLGMLTGHRSEENSKLMAHERELQNAELDYARNANTMNMLTNILGTAAMFAI